MANPKRFEWIEDVRLPLMIGVVLIHTYDPVRVAGGAVVSLQGFSFATDYILFFFSQVLSRLSVPVFFVISGLLFVEGVATRGVVGIRSSLIRRVRTIFVPFVMWNVLLFVAIWTLISFEFLELSDNSRYDWIGSVTFAEYFDRIFGLSGYPISYQFWFLRDLIIVLLLMSVPVVLLDLWALAAVVCVLFFCWMGAVLPVEVPALGSLFWFSFGALLSRGRRYFCLETVPHWVLGLYCSLALVEYFFRGEVWYGVLHRFVLCVGVLSIVHMASLIGGVAPLRVFCRRFAGASFFVFAFHEPLLTVLKKLSFSYVESAFTAVGAYCFSVIVSVAIAIVVFELLRRHAPKVLAVATGGR